MGKDASEAGGSGSFQDLKIRPTQGFFAQQLLTLSAELLEAILITSRSRWFQLMGMVNYTSGFMAPSWTALQYFSNLEKNGSNGGYSFESALDFIELMLFEMQLATRGAMADMSAMSNYHVGEMLEALAAFKNTLLKKNDEDLVRFSERQLRLMDMVVNIYPAPFGKSNQSLDFISITAGMSGSLKQIGSNSTRCFPLIRRSRCARMASRSW